MYLKTEHTLQQRLGIDSLEGAPDAIQPSTNIRTDEWQPEVAVKRFVPSACVQSKQNCLLGQTVSLSHPLPLSANLNVSAY